MNALIRTSAPRARKRLTLLWYIFFAIDVAIVFYLYLADWIETDNFRNTLESLNGLFAPYLGAILLFYWGSRTRTGTDESVKTGTGFTLALIGSVIWNLIVLIFLVPLLIGSGKIETAVEDIQFAGGLLSWLVAGAIGYYFANPGESATG